MTIPADDLGSVGAGHDGLAATFQFGLEQVACRLVELALHQRRHEMNDGDRHAAKRKAMRCLEPEQATADHHG